ncbi:MAG: lysine--tRNA ligase [Planctomycetes bacterium]|nr:lysine--tRNA ligase [Planctomycetota bacterium]
MSNQQRDERLKTLDKLRALGLDPFGGKFVGARPIAELLAGYNPTQEAPAPTVTAAGRIRTIRDMGKAAFADLRDSSGKVQLYFKQNQMGDALWNLYKCLDLGDLVGVSGELFKTRTGELSIGVKQLTLLCKSILPLPEKYHGLRDVELRYRHRYLDMIANPEVQDTFRRRIRILSQIRRYLDERAFLEVETPMMHPIPGGAAARPFITHHNTLDMELYLRIAPELYLKRLLVGGFERVYEINRNFRNEGIDTRHNPEFTMMEVYQAYGDYNDMMDLTEGLFVHLARDVQADLRLPYGEMTLDLTPPWPRRKYLELFRQHVGFEWDDRARVLERAAADHIPTGTRPIEAVAGDLFERHVEPTLAGPVFITEYPTPICPLTKAKREDPKVCERFELFIAHMELANAFTELNDPLDQRERFLRQLANKDEGMARLDEDFLLALEHGMPPAGGLGIGIDRLVMLLTNSHSIRDVVLFPLLREHRDLPAAEAAPEAAAAGAAKPAPGDAAPTSAP